MYAVGIGAAGSLRASYGFRGRGGWSARRGAAGWASAAGAWPGRCASAIRPRTLRPPPPVCFEKPRPVRTCRPARPVRNRRGHESGSRVEKRSAAAAYPSLPGRARRARRRRSPVPFPCRAVHRRRRGIRRKRCGPRARDLPAGGIRWSYRECAAPGRNRAFESSEDLQERGLAGAVGAHQSRPLVGRDQPVGILEKEVRAETFAGIGELEHMSILAGLRGELRYASPRAQNASGRAPPAGWVWRSRLRLGRSIRRRVTGRCGRGWGTWRAGGSAG